VSAGKVDVLAILDLIAQLPTHPPKDERNLRALEVAKLNAPTVRAAVADLIEADHEYDAARAEWLRVRDLAADAHYLTVLGRYDKAKDRRAAALARIGGAP
jgi:hypothetical protein